MTFIFQQPGTARLLEAIDHAAANADSGGGVFAFASKGGIDALFARPNLSRMLTHHQPFHLIVGIDAITNAEALLCLSDKLNQFGQVLTVDVFFHEHPSSTFHPKFSWFREGNHLHVMTGSGNLTLRGVGQLSVNDYPSGNWEAFSVQSLRGKNAAVAHREIDDWLTAQRTAGKLCSIDDERIRDRAMANGRVRFARTPSTTSRTPSRRAVIRQEDVAPVDDVELGTEVLLREIPRNRTGQADIGKAALTEFFGYAGVGKNVFIQHVSLDNTLGPTDSIWLFVNESQNYRLELRAIAALTYDVGADDSRMILVATKLDRRSFRYTMVPVPTPDYRQIAALLAPVPAYRGRTRPMREARVSSDQVRTTWPDVPANLLPVDLPTPEP